MSREAFWSMVLLIGGGVALGMIQLARLGEAGSVYVRQIERSVDAPPTATRPAEVLTWTEYRSVAPRERDQPDVFLSVPRTIGLWIAALLTLCVFSFLAGDNPAYKLAESVFVGVSAGYAMVAGFWDQIVQNLLANLFPAMTRAWGVAHLDRAPDALPPPEYLYLVPLALGVMMLWQLAPKGGWIARYPLAFFIGATAGIRMVAFFEADFLRLIQQTLMPLVVIVDDGRVAPETSAIDWSASIAASLRNTAIVVGVVASLTYFFFSLEHRGPVRIVSRTGIYVLMITFGAGFAYTVMGRIALLAERIEFLFIDWLWLIDPLGTRG
jgi:hypothetical protein